MDKKTTSRKVLKNLLADTRDLMRSLEKGQLSEKETRACISQGLALGARMTLVYYGVPGELAGEPSLREVSINGVSTLVARESVSGLDFRNWSVERQKRLSSVAWAVQRYVAEFLEQTLHGKTPASSFEPNFRKVTRPNVCVMQ